MIEALEKGLTYNPPLDLPDEMVSEDGTVRENWADLLSSVSDFGSDEFEARLESMRRLLRENGVTFNVFGDDDALQRLWQLDPFPLILEAREWTQVEAGLRQRVRLLEKLLEDVYGSQLCLKEGWLPPELVLGNPGFLRPCHGLPVPRESRLLLHSVDIARNKKGEFVVLRDRSETPGGAGYALENRLALARMMPEFFQCRGIRRLAPFFRGLRNTLFELGERIKPNPRVVFLTPGTLSQTYFEQAYLAQYLGLTLVHGDDLTVRDNRVYLKLLGGLQPVDVIVKRLRDAYCDPLELRSDSVLGIPGLIQSVRAGNVIVANAVGGAFLETPALHAYLPQLCKQLLNEELKLPGVPTWWCGAPESLSYVLDNLDDLVLKPLFPARSGIATFLEGESAAKKEQVKTELRRNPSAFVAQEQLSLSTVPCFSSQGLEPRRTLLRTFVARDGKNHLVMPGALALASGKPGSIIASLESGASSKDTWIIHEEQAKREPREGTGPKGAIRLSRGGGDIPSRLADNLFWLGRYLERGENLARLLRCAAARMDDDSGGKEGREFRLLLHLFNPRWQPKAGTELSQNLRARLFGLLNKDNQSDGLRPVLQSVRRLTATVRDSLSSDSWRIANRLAELSKQEPENAREVQVFLDDLILIFSAFCGLIKENTTRSHRWRFLEIGRRLERADFSIAVLRRAMSKNRSESESLVLELLLEIADGSRTYRRRYPSGLQTAPVLDLLLADPDNPRSVTFQLVSLERHLQCLPGPDPSTPDDPEDLILLRCRTAIRLANITELASKQKRGQLRNLLRDVGKEIPALSDYISKRYLTHLIANDHGDSFGREVLP